MNFLRCQCRKLAYFLVLKDLNRNYSKIQDGRSKTSHDVIERNGQQNLGYLVAQAYVSKYFFAVP